MLLLQLNNEFVPLEIILLAKVADVDGVIRMLDAFKTNDGNFLIIMQRPEQVCGYIEWMPQPILIEYIPDEGLIKSLS